MLLARPLQIVGVKRFIDHGRVRSVAPCAHHSGGNIARTGPHRMRTKGVVTFSRKSEAGSCRALLGDVGDDTAAKKLATQSVESRDAR